ncbi:glycoprotein 3-alpha-L-fucosyltransferase A-like [Watersipora subatra]|uniref:glycoprotein 3-alpha-L-fucosyltransferase A-like n=1 Tax=Watersipora subatra TaxID=2589382 RepID=UPI00355B8877
MTESSTKTKTRDRKIKTLRLRVGIRRATKPKLLKCGKYQCSIQSGGKPGHADLTMFNVDSVEHFNIPPRKRAGELWAFQTTEPQWFSAKDQYKWNGLFNYSVTYVAGTDGARYNFADTLSKKASRTFAEFAAIKTEREAKALWFVSHCRQPNRKLQVTSARDVYVQELVKYIAVDVFTRQQNCRELFGSLIKKEDPEKPPKLNQYTFYLAFENSLCKDYITEKLWKVLEAKSYTIPVVLGGLSIDEYKLVAPPNSFIHVKNFSSPKALADHLKHVAENDDAFNYYMQWRNEYDLRLRGTFVGMSCYYCKLAHTRPPGIWNTFSKDFGSHNCINMTASADHCPYYNLSCPSPSMSHKDLS